MFGVRLASRDNGGGHGNPARGRLFLCPRKRNAARHVRRPNIDLSPTRHDSAADVVRRVLACFVIVKSVSLS